MEWRGERGVEIGDRRVGRGEWGLKRRGVRSREVGGRGGVEIGDREVGIGEKGSEEWRGER